MNTQSYAVGMEAGEGSAAVVVVRGEVDMASAPGFEAELTSAVGRKREGLVVDLTEVTFIDSAGINALVRAFERQRRVGQGLALVVNDRRVTMMLEVSRLDRILPAYETRAQAVAALSARRP